MRGSRPFAQRSVALALLAVLVALPAAGASVCLCEKADLPEIAAAATVAVVPSCHGHGGGHAPAAGESTSPDQRPRSEAPVSSEGHCAMACHAPAILAAPAVLAADMPRLEVDLAPAPRPLAALPREIDHIPLT